MGVYQNLYNLIVQYVFGGSIDPLGYEELVTVLLSSCGSVLCVVLPFIIVFWAIKSLFN